MRLELLLEPAGQLEDGALMGGAGGGRHDEIAPDDLVAQMVVGEAPNLLGGVSRHRVQWVRAEVRVDVPRACARGQCYNVYRRSRGLRTQTAPHGV